MTSPTYITTSWDDGHPNDLRLAAMLAKYGIAATFYVPATAERKTMSAGQLRELARGFEIGAHTLHHVDLTDVADRIAWPEIADSKAWIEDRTGVRCACFCPPIGRYKSRHLGMVQRAGYLGLRSTELLSLDFPRPQAGLLLLPTTVQAFPHRLPAFARNAIKRLALANLWRYVVYGQGAAWSELAAALLRRAVARGGVFHLWGHSWELEDHAQWRRLEDVLCFMAGSLPLAPAVTNGQLCQLAASPRASVHQATKIAPAGG